MNEENFYWLQIQKQHCNPSNKILTGSQKSEMDILIKILKSKK